MQLFAADDFSRRHFQMHVFLGALRLNKYLIYSTYRGKCVGVILVTLPLSYGLWSDVTEPIRNLLLKINILIMHFFNIFILKRFMFLQQQLAVSCA